jgi:hypothetical protein
LMLLARRATVVAVIRRYGLLARGNEGRLDVLALGILPISCAEHSSALMWRVELMRYLAELAWAPDAILLNTELRWREDGPDEPVVQPDKIIGYMFTVRLLQQAMEINTQSMDQLREVLFGSSHVFLRSNRPPNSRSKNTVIALIGKNIGERTSTVLRSKALILLWTPNDGEQGWTTYWWSERDSNRGALVRDFGNLFLVGSSTIGVETRSRRSNRPRAS